MGGIFYYKYAYTYIFICRIIRSRRFSCWRAAPAGRGETLLHVAFSHTVFFSPFFSGFSQKGVVLFRCRILAHCFFFLFSFCFFFQKRDRALPLPTQKFRVYLSTPRLMLPQSPRWISPVHVVASLPVTPCALAWKAFSSHLVFPYRGLFAAPAPPSFRPLKRVSFIYPADLPGLGKTGINNRCGLRRI